MAKRIPLAKRTLPSYTRGEEIMNMVTHIVGGGMGILALVLCLYKTITRHGGWDIVGGIIYGLSMIELYCMSSIYHGLKPCKAKKVMQVLDHCTIYLLIAGTYTPIMITSFIPVYPVLGWTILIVEWALAALAGTLTAIDLRKSRVFSMICYIVMGWAILPFCSQAIAVMGSAGFWLLLSGGIAYTVGSILYGIGSKLPWFHGVFHIFVVVGSLLQFLAIYLYVL